MDTILEILQGLFDSDDIDEKFEGFLPDWVWDSERYQRRNTPNCNILGGGAYQHLDFNS